MKHIAETVKDYVGGAPRSVRSLEEHLDAAAAWIVRAQQAGSDGGVPHSYDLRIQGWLPSYPETTGYIIPTLYDYARYYGKSSYADAARRMAEWESSIQLEEGGVRAGHMGAEVVVPTIFNTGQVLFGWARAFQETGDERFRDSLVRAATWLLAAQDEDGAWREHPSPFTSSKLNSYNTRTAFGLIRAYRVVGDERYLHGAQANVRWTLSRARANGWLPNNSLTTQKNDQALTHTIAYSIRGILEVGVTSRSSEFVDHAYSMAREVAKQQREDGALPGYYDPQWRSAVKWTCVTGNSQMAINWLRLAQETKDTRLVEHAVRANRFNMGIQKLDDPDPGIRGAMKGSHPVNGGYMTYRYPNWAAKFFMDALMLEQLRDRVIEIG